MSALERQRKAQELYELKQQAMAYYKENGIPEKMEEVLNSMFYHNPRDSYGHVSNFFASHSLPPSITKLIGRETYDSRGQLALQCELYCDFRNKERCFSSPSVPNNFTLPEGAPAAEKEVEEKNRPESVSAAVEMLNTKMTEKLKDKDPNKQRECDDCILNVLLTAITEEEERIAKEKEEAAKAAEAGDAPEEQPVVVDSKKSLKSPKGKKGAMSASIVPDEPREKIFLGSDAVSAASIAVCMGAAATNDQQLFEYITELRNEEPQDMFKVPLPMITVIQHGKAALGKCNCVKEFMLVPRPTMSISECMKHVAILNDNITKATVSKAGVQMKNVGELGAITPQLERPEQALDMIQDAITQIGLEPGVDFFIALNLAGHDCFDYDKGKYEIMSGQLKTGDDLVEYWAELLGRYSSIIAIIDPMRKVDKQPWMKLCERVSERCYIMGDNVLHRPGRLRDETMSPFFKMSAGVLKYDLQTTVSDLIDAAAMLEGEDCSVAITSGFGETADTYIVDLAVGLGVQFVKFGGPSRAERGAKYNRLLQIDDYLRRREKNSDWGEFKFPLIKPPTPEPEPVEGEESSPATPK